MGKGHSYKTPEMRMERWMEKIKDKWYNLKRQSEIRLHLAFRSLNQIILDSLFLCKATYNTILTILILSQGLKDEYKIPGFGVGCREYL